MPDFHYMIIMAQIIEVNDNKAVVRLHQLGQPEPVVLVVSYNKRGMASTLILVCLSHSYPEVIVVR